MNTNTQSIDRIIKSVGTSSPELKSTISIGIWENLATQLLFVPPCNNAR